MVIVATSPHIDFALTILTKKDSVTFRLLQLSFMAPKRRPSQENKKNAPRRPSQETKPTITIPKKEGLIIDAPTVKPAAPPPKEEAPAAPAAPVQVVTTPSISKPVTKPVQLTISAEASQQIQQRKASHTYTIEQMKARKHEREYTSPAVFQFNAELQLFKRYTSGTRKNKSKIQAKAIPVLQHHINTILLKFNVNTFQSVFNEMCALGIENEVFVLSFVNVVYKQAVLNPSLALLFSMLSMNIAYVMKHTPFANRMRELYLERCNESFVIPKDENDKGLIILQRGIVIFAGHLLRDGMLQPTLLTQWAKLLLQDGSVTSLKMLLDLFLAGGQPLIQANQAIVDQLDKSVKKSTDKDLLSSYATLLEIVKGDVSPTDQTKRELKDPEMARSPSMDRSLDNQYGSLFKRSDSVPQSLSNLGHDDDAPLHNIINQYLINSDLQEFIKAFEGLSYKKGDLSTSMDLIRAIIDQPEDNQMVVAELVHLLHHQGFYDETLLKDGFKAIAGETPKDTKRGDGLAHLYALLLNEELVSFDDFENLFDEMRPIWNHVIPRFFIEVDQLKGDWIDEMLESEFWAKLKFLGVEGIENKFTKLNEWDIIQNFPHYDVAYTFYDKAKGRNDASNYITDCDPSVDKNELGKVVFEVLTILPENSQKANAQKLKRFFNQFKVAQELAPQFGEKGAQVLALLK